MYCAIRLGCIVWGGVALSGQIMTGPIVAAVWSRIYDLGLFTSTECVNTGEGVVCLGTYLYRRCLGSWAY